MTIHWQSKCLERVTKRDRDILVERDKGDNLQIVAHFRIVEEDTASRFDLWIACNEKNRTAYVSHSAYQLSELLIRTSTTTTRHRHTHIQCGLERRLGNRDPYTQIAVFMHVLVCLYILGLRCFSIGSFLIAITRSRSVSVFIMNEREMLFVVLPQILRLQQYSKVSPLTSVLLQRPSCLPVYLPIFRLRCESQA